jgi:hypothetical protein
MLHASCSLKFCATVCLLGFSPLWEIQVFNPAAYSAYSKQGNHKEIMENCEVNQYWNNIGISGKWTVVEFSMLQLCKYIGHVYVIHAADTCQ